MFALQQTTVQGIVAVAGIIGRLLGALIGAGVTLHVQKKQREHDDETRFHQERLRNYARFTDALNGALQPSRSDSPLFIGRTFHQRLDPTRTPREMAIAWATEERRALTGAVER